MKAKRPLLAALSAVALTLVTAAPSSPSDTRAHELIRLLKLEPLPRESGYLGIIGRSAQTVTIHGRNLAVQSQNYYMLTRDQPINYLHWLAAGRHAYPHRRRPRRLLHLSSRRPRRKDDPGNAIVAAGERPVVAVPGGCWKALRLHDGASYALMANTLSPEFTPDRVKIGAGADWIKRFTNAAPWAHRRNTARHSSAPTGSLEL